MTERYTKEQWLNSKVKQVRVLDWQAAEAIAKQEFFTSDYKHNKPTLPPKPKSILDNFKGNITVKEIRIDPETGKTFVKNNDFIKHSRLRSTNYEYVNRNDYTSGEVKDYKHKKALDILGHKY